MNAPPMAPSFSSAGPNIVYSGAVGDRGGVAPGGATVKPNDTEQKIIQQVATLVASGGEET